MTVQLNRHLRLTGAKLVLLLDCHSGVALGKSVEYGYEFAADIAKRVKAPATARQPVSAQ